MVSDSGTLSLSVRVQLSAMMFFQFMMLAVWFVPLADYLDNSGVQGTFRALILSSMALGCLVSPIVGTIADRHFAAQKVLFVLNLLSAILLVAAARFTSPTIVFVLLLFQMLCYMPSWGLTSAIAMGTFADGQVSSNTRLWLNRLGRSGAVQPGGRQVMRGTRHLMVPICRCTVVRRSGLIGAVVALALPDTPPKAKGQKASLVDVMGLRTFTLMKDFDFAIFIIVSLLVMVPFASYWSYGSLFLSDRGFEYITVTMNWGQLAEMLFMLLVPVVLVKAGIRWTMVLGLIALVVRFASFLVGDMYDKTGLYFVAILVQGLIYGFFFVGGQMYIDRKAPVEIRAQGTGCHLSDHIRSWPVVG